MYDSLAAMLYNQALGITYSRAVNTIIPACKAVSLCKKETVILATSSYLRTMTGAKAAVLCFSTTDRFSFESLESWKKKIEEQCGRIPMVLVQTKVDLLDEAAVERICAKQNLYVAEVFEYLAELYLRWDEQSMQTPRVVIGVLMMVRHELHPILV
ncbi:hypothetical protein L7F22_002409 [Adiantum nelumboides]|nr:hypothetical protein [Adiantum nelumboides]